MTRRSRSREHTRHHHHHRRHKSHSHSRSRSRSRSPDRPLPYQASSITEDDYFQKIDEFRVWLKDEKDKYFDDLSGEKQRQYFRKFVKAWNRGRLSKFLYGGVDPPSARANTGYKWNFAGRDEVGASSSSSSHHHHSSNHGNKIQSGRIKGPSMPTASDLTMARELQAENTIADAKLKRKRDRLEAKDRIEDMVGPKAVGKEATLEKKRVKQDSARSFREGKEDAGLEVDDSTLMGSTSGDSFKAQIARRDAAKQRYQQVRETKDGERDERQSQYKEKEKATMDMFKQLAQQRFG